MAEVSKAQLAISNSADFPDNTSGLITPAILRGFNTQMIDSLVDEIGYTADSASFSSSIAQLQSFSSSLDATFATDAQLTALSTSVAVTDLAQDGKINSLINATGSYITSAQTASMSVASASFATLASTASFLSGSIASASFATSASFAQTASFLLGAIASASFATSASFAVTSSLAQNVVIIARNGNASTLGAGTIVHITGASGDNPIFNTASYDTELLSANTLGVLRQSAASGADVDVLVNGIVTGVNTDPANGYVAGDIIYLSSSGQFTRVQPQAPNQVVTIGQVLRAQQNNGSIYVNINNGWELNELHNVAINGVADGDLLVYRSGSGLWTNSSSIELGNATTGSNTFTGNQIISGTVNVNNNVGITGSLDVNGVNIVNQLNTLINATSSYVTEAETSSFATTGSNTFIGDQKITGSVRIDGDLIVDDDGGTTSFLLNAKFGTEFLGSQMRWQESAKKATWDFYESLVDINLSAYSASYDNGLSINLRSDGTTFSDYNTSYVTQSWLRIPVNSNNNPAPQFTRGAGISGSVILSGSMQITGSAPTHLLVSGGVNYSGSLLSNATDTFPSVAQGNFVVTLSSASMATLLSGGTTNANTLYFVV